MDKASQERLDGIIAKEPAALTEPDIEFLRARSAYLTPDQAKKYAEVIGDDRPSGGDDPGDQEPPASTPAESPAKSKKKGWLG